MADDDPDVDAAVKSVPPETRQVEQEMSPRAERAIGLDAETATVPLAFGNVQVLSEAVRSADVMIPLKVLVAVPDCGWIWMVSELAVDEAKVALLVVVTVAWNAPEF